MKTRTLMLLALACGLAIMAAGAVFLFQLSTQDEPAPAVALGSEARAGDMVIVVERADEAAGVLEVTVRIGGVADADGASGFRLIASGRAVRPGAGAGSCGATAETVEPCVLRFDVAGADGASRVLFYERGDAILRWVLA